MTYTPSEQELIEMGFKKSKKPFIGNEGGREFYYEPYYIFQNGRFVVDCIADKKFHDCIVGQYPLKRFSIVHRGGYCNLFPQSREDIEALIRLLTPR